MRIRVQDEVILAAHVADVPSLFEKIVELKAGEAIRLKVDGIQGTWIKISMRDGSRTQHGLAPLGAMATIWSGMQQPWGKSVELEILATTDPEEDGYLRLVDDLLSPELNSKEDEEAFGGLRPL